MPRRYSRAPDPRNVLRELHPTISILVLATGIVVWAYQTFAQLSYVKEQNQTMQSLVEQRHKEAIDHSDQNRERMLAMMQDIKDTVRSIDARMWRDVKKDEHDHTVTGR